MKDKIIVLFSGGRDSSLATCKLAERGNLLYLLNFDNGATIEKEVTKIKFEELRKRYPDNIVHFAQKAIFGLFRKLALENIEKDFLKHKTNLICLGCKLASHVEAIIYGVENSISIIADGYNRYQANEFMEQRAEAIEIIKNFCSEYGILYINPIYNYESKKTVKYSLFEHGISFKSLEGSCLFGDTASIPSKQDVISYIYDRLQICREYIKARTQKGEEMSQQPKIHKIGAIIVKDKKILVVHKQFEDRAEYIIPGGRPESGESHEDTLRRELQEELGVDLLSYKQFGSFQEIAIFENIPIFMDVYFTEISGTPKPRTEIKKLVWIDKDYEKQGIQLGTVLSRHVIPKLVNDGLL